MKTHWRDEALLIEEEDKPVQTKSLFISAGHSNTDPGAVGNGYSEADIVLELRDLLAEELRQRGVEFSKDGDKGTNLPLSQAWKMAAQHDIAVEFHCNAFHTASATGVEALCDESNAIVAGKLCKAVVDATGLSNRGVKDESVGQHSRLAFISSGEGIIMELFFISNPNDVRAYLDNKQSVVTNLADVLEEAVMGE